MNEHIEHQIIKDKGKPLFVLVPYEKYIKLISEKETGPTIPHDVVELHIMENKSLIRSWREYKRLSQQEVAQKMNITQAAYSQMEKSGIRLRKSTLEKIAFVLGIQLEQLRI